MSEVGLTRRADPPRSDDFDPEAEVWVKCDVFWDFLSRAETIHAAGDKWADRGGSALTVCHPFVTRSCAWWFAILRLIFRQFGRERVILPRFLSFNLLIIK